MAKGIIQDNLGKVFGILAVIAIVGAVVYANQASNAANEGVELTPHTKGNEAATVTLVEYSDFQCPACAQFYPFIKEVITEYEDDLKFEYKHFPLIQLHPFAVPAAKAAEAAGQQGKFFEMHDKLFENQSTWSSSPNPVTYFNTYAEELGLDMALYKRHYKASLIEDRIQDEFQAARALGFTGTPTLVLNGTEMEVTSFEDFRSQIEAALGVGAAPSSTVRIESDEAGIETTATLEATPATDPEVRFGF